MYDDYLNYTNQNETVSSGAAYHNTEEDSEGGMSIMPPEDQFSNQPLESGGSLGYEDMKQEPGSQEEETGEWKTPREHEKVDSKEAAKTKVLEVRKRIIFLIDMAKGAPGIVKKPESIGDLTELGNESIKLYASIRDDASGEPKLTSTQARNLNLFSSKVEISYGDVFGEITNQARKASRNLASVPRMVGLDESLKELLRSNFADGNQSELDSIVDTYNGTKQYNDITALMRSACLSVVGKVGGMVWAEGLERLEKEVKKKVEDLLAKGQYFTKLIGNIITMFGSDPSHPTEAMRNTFDTIGTVIDNPFTKILNPLWTAYKPAIDICMKGIDEIKRQRDEQFNLIGISKGLIEHVQKDEKDKITSAMTLGLPGASERGKLELLHFMMDISSSSMKDLLDYEASSSVKEFFWNKLDLFNAGSGKDRIETDYNNPLNPFDNELKDLAIDVYMSKEVVWSMLYGNMLKAPGK